MSLHFRLLTWAFFLTAFSFSSILLAADPEADSELFEKTTLIYEDDFEGPLNENFWEIRQSSTWVIKDGILTGSQSSKEFQKMKLAKGDKAHAGFKPVIWLKQVPENFVCTMRMRYNAKAYHPRFPLLDLGHHIHTLSFGESSTTLTIRKNVEIIKLEEQFLPLNEWVNVRIELKKGTILLKIGDKKHIFKSANIDMAGHSQIDFKGVDFGTCQIDQIKVWKGQ